VPKRALRPGLLPSSEPHAARQPIESPLIDGISLGRGCLHARRSRSGPSWRQEHLTLSV